MEGVSFLADGASVPDCDRLICMKATAPDCQAGRRIVYSHGAEQPSHDGWDAIVAVSDYHAALLRARLPLAHVVPIPMGLPARVGPIATSRERFLYTSSPDRGLHRLLVMWPAIWNRFHRPLSITYDLPAVLRWATGSPGAFGSRMRFIASCLDQPGIVVHGAMDRAAIQRLQSQGLALLYPLDPLAPFSELFALAVMEACGAGTPPLLSPVDCFPSVYRDAAMFVHGYEARTWLDAIEQTLDDPGAGTRVIAFAARRTEEDWAVDWERLLSSFP